MIAALLVEGRPRQWTKNLVLFAGVIFARRFTDPQFVGASFSAFALFCLLSSGVYMLNDVADLENDKLHPRKRLRPLAAGRIGRGPVIAAAIIAIVGGVGLSFLLRPLFGVMAVLYLILNFGYSAGLKRIVILDVLAIAVGFVFRAVAGVEALPARVEISPWLLVCTFFLALFLAIGKRRAELANRDAAPASRPVLGEYSIPLLDQMIAIVTSATVIGYSIYTVNPSTVEKYETQALVFTVPFVVFGVFRYLYLLYRREGGGSPSEVLITDVPILVTVVLWALAVFIILSVLR
jgi:4-hydroxybenzoate polyprenyltransferase